MLHSSVKIKYADILRIAFPMIISQAAEITMQFVDRLFLSTIGITELSAALTGGISAFVFQSFFLGLIGYTTALVAQFYGAQDIRMCNKTVVQGLILSVLAYPVSLLLIPLGRLSFSLASHSSELIQLEFSYFAILMIGSILTFIRTCIAGYFVGIAKAKIVLIANIIGMLINIPLNYILIFGKLGLHPLGIVGAAIGTLISVFSITLFLFVSFLLELNHTQKSLIYNFDKAIIRTFAKFGIPSGINLLLNSLAFNVGIQLFHSYGSGIGTAFSITMNYDAIAFIPMIGLGFATTSVVGRFMGANDPGTARKAGFMAWRISLVYALGIMLLFIFASKPLVNLFASQFLNTQYIILAQNMIRLASFYTLADMTQLVFVSALRGAGDTKWVMKITLILHWSYAIAVILCIRVFQVEPIITWIVFIVFIICLGIIMLHRFFQGKWQSLSVLSFARRSISYK